MQHAFLKRVASGICSVAMLAAVAAAALMVDPSRLTEVHAGAVEQGGIGLDMSLELPARSDADQATPDSTPAEAIALLNAWIYTHHDCASDRGRDRGRGHDKHKNKGKGKNKSPDCPDDDDDDDDDDDERRGRGRGHGGRDD